MTKNQLSAALELAQSKANLQNEDDSIFNGFGLPNFQPVTCTIPQLARLIRWQCVQMNGKIDAKALNEIADFGKKRFMVV